MVQTTDDAMMVVVVLRKEKIKRLFQLAMIVSRREVGMTATIRRIFCVVFAKHKMRNAVMMVVRNDRMRQYQHIDGQHHNDRKHLLHHNNDYFSDCKSSNNFSRKSRLGQKTFGILEEML
jgi:hypothetical protein